MPSSSSDPLVRVCPRCGSIAVFASSKSFTCKQCGLKDSFPQLRLDDLQPFRDQLATISKNQKSSRGLSSSSSAVSKRTKLFRRIFLFVLLGILIFFLWPFLAELF